LSREDGVEGEGRVEMRGKGLGDAVVKLYLGEKKSQKHENIYETVFVQLQEEPLCPSVVITLARCDLSLLKVSQYFILMRYKCSHHVLLCARARLLYAVKLLVWFAVTWFVWFEYPVESKA
jgi:hypothetical protein